MKKFLEDLAVELKKLKMSKKEIDEIIEDHKEMIDQAQEEGLSEDEITNKFGNPSKLAKDLYSDSNDSFSQEVANINLKDFDLFKSFPVISNLEKIRAKVVSEDVSFYPHDEETIEVYFKNVKESNKYEVTFEKGTLLFAREKELNIFRNTKSNEEEIVIMFPKGIKLLDFNFTAVSGDLVLDNILTKEFRVKTTSGDCEMVSSKAEYCEFSTVSGEFKIENVTIEKDMKLSAVSGDFHMFNTSIKDELKLHTVSGDFEFENVSCKYADFTSVSGDLKSKEFYPRKVDLKSVSGDIKIENTDKLRVIQVGRKKSVSGDITIK